MYLAVILAAFGALLIFRTWAMVLFSVLSLEVILRARQEDAVGKSLEKNGRPIVRKWMAGFQDSEKG